MSNRDSMNETIKEMVYADPVAYLARFGIAAVLVEAEPVEDSTLPAAA